MDSLAAYTVSVGGRTRKARILKSDHGNNTTIELDGRAFEVAFPNGVKLDRFTLISVNGRNHKIKLAKNNRPRIFNVEIGGNPFILQLETCQREINTKNSLTTNSPSYTQKKEKIIVKKSGAVTSAMPGKVTLLKVRAGDKIKTGDPICVLEAMKMENEIIATREGTVTQVEVEQGSIVRKGDVLVVIE